MRSRRRCSGSCMTSSRQHRSRPSVRLGRPARSARAVARSSRTGRRQGRLAGRRPGGRDRRLVGAVNADRSSSATASITNHERHRADSQASQTGCRITLGHCRRSKPSIRCRRRTSRLTASHWRFGPAWSETLCGRVTVATAPGSATTTRTAKPSASRGRGLQGRGPGCIPPFDSFAAPLLRQCGSWSVAPGCRGRCARTAGSPTAMPAAIARISPEAGDAGMRPASDDRRPPAERRIGGG